MQVGKEKLLWMFEKMVQIRYYEETMASVYMEGKLPPAIQKGLAFDIGAGPVPGEMHLAAGQEPVAVGICAHLSDDDTVVGTHRPHHFAIAKGVPLDPMTAEMFGKVGNWQAALECQLEAVRLNEIEGDQQFLGLSFQNAGNCLGELGQFKEAIEYHKKAVAIYTEAQELDDVSSCFEKIAEFSLELGEYVEAIAYGQRALNLSFFSYEIDSLAKTHLILTKAFLAQGDLERSGQHLVDAQGLANLASEKNWKLIAEVEQTRISHLKAGGFADDADEAEVRLRTLRELVK
jgi:tetratricopeptide (TPR) repeat protein